MDSKRWWRRWPARSALVAAGLVMALGLAAEEGTPERAPDEGNHLWHAWLLQAAPGELEQVIASLRERLPVWQEGYPGGPFWMRHSQGDRWDLLLLFPWGDPASFHSAEGAARRTRAAERSGVSDRAFLEALLPRIAWQEDLFVLGPPPEAVAGRFEGAGLFHVEMFRALPGKRRELVEERRMENVYLEAIGSPRNLIFVRAGGASWDCFTLGAYRDMKHFAANGDVSQEEEDRAARKAGFDRAGAIGFYLRALIAEHHDTLAVPPG